MIVETGLQHFVLVGPSGKQAGRKDQHKIALQIEALWRQRTGLGGGISDLLIPTSPKEMKTINRLIGKGYRTKKVVGRKNYRKGLREKLIVGYLITVLAARFVHDLGDRRLENRSVVREFSKWVCKNLNDQYPNEIKRIIGAVDDELLNMRKPDWWKNQINQRVMK